jgi:hypothetical protein
MDPMIINEMKKRIGTQPIFAVWSNSLSLASPSAEILRTISDQPSCVEHSNMVKSPVVKVPK